MKKKNFSTQTKGSALDLSGAYSVPRPPAMLSNDLQSLHILSKTRLSIPHLWGGNFFRCVLQGEENFLSLALQENYIPPHIKKMIRHLPSSFITSFLMIFPPKVLTKVLFASVPNREILKVNFVVLGMLT